MCCLARGYQYLYNANPYYKLLRYPTYPAYFNSIGSNYANHVPLYNSPYVSTLPQFLGTDPIASYVTQSTAVSTLNVLAEVPYSIEKSFTVVPMLLVSQDSLNMVSNAHIINVSKKKPTMVIKTDKNVLQCTPAVKIVLQQPIIVYSFKTPILFPSEMTIVHDNVRIPIRVGAVIAPIAPEIHVSEEAPVSIEVVYAIPTKPIKFDYVNNNKDVVIDTNAQAVIVDNAEHAEEELKVPVLHFPTVEAEPIITVNEDEELGKINIY